MSIPDPRDYLETEHIGTRLRDGAVDPKPGDFLGPTNAGAEGEAGNPHGPNVVSPGVHGSEQLRPVRPGPVSADADEQSADETAHLVEHVPSASNQQA